MSQQLYHQVCRKASKMVTQSYSTSFSMGIRLLNKDLREPIYSIYGFVRFADEIVDTFHEHPKRELLERFKKDTYTAIEEGISLNPILHSFQEVVNKYNIEREVIETFLRSMELDLDRNEYDQAGYEDYILGSAEVVGLMCLSVFCGGDHSQYESLKPAAMKLGSAFQKVNFLRDLKADYHHLGRTYFPGVDLNYFDAETKRSIEKDIQDDFDQAFEGIKRLPATSKYGVYLAYVYYTSLFNKIKRTPPQVILNERVRIPNKQKYALLVGSYVRYRMNMV